MTGGLSASAGMRLRGLLLAQGRLRRFESNSPEGYSEAAKK